MFSIGEFARFGGVSVRMLRHYDRVGLLRPQRVDPRTGYRSYSTSQLDQLNRIVALRELGFTLTQIAELSRTVSLEEMRGMLQLRRAQVESDLAEQSTQLARIEARLRLIEGETRLPTHEIVLRGLPAQRVAVIANRPTSFAQDDLGEVLRPAFEELIGALGEVGVDAEGFPFAFFTGSEDEGDLVAYAAIGVGDQAKGLSGRVELMELPEVPEAATVIRKGPIDHTYREIYAELARWVEEHGYVPVGAGRDVFVDPFPADGESVTEIQWPLRRPDGPEPDVTPRPCP
jgi:DNA-binding transcriptional MerR regulator